MAAASFSEPVTGVAIAHRQHEEAEPDGQHDDVLHSRAPDEIQSRATLGNIASGDAECCPFGAAVTCHSAHRFSRGTRGRNYRNSIKMPARGKTRGLVQRPDAQAAPGVVGREQVDLYGIRCICEIVVRHCRTANATLIGSLFGDNHFHLVFEWPMMKLFPFGKLAAEARGMAGMPGSQDWRERKIREWLLLLLRFAVTREIADRSMVSAAADELDSIGGRRRSDAPSFFQRTSRQVCDAILAADDPRNIAVLKRHLGRIDDVRLRLSFAAAVGLSAEEVSASAAS